MHSVLAADPQQPPALLATACELRLEYLYSLPDRPVAGPTVEPPPVLPETGPRAEAARFLADLRPAAKLAALKNGSINPLITKPK